MKIGILTPSVYMYQKRYTDRIFAPGDLVRHLVDGLSKREHEVVWFSAPEEHPRARMVEGDRTLLEKDLKIRVFQDVPPELLDKLSLYGTKMYYELDLVSRAYAQAKKDGIDVLHVFHSFGFFAHFFEELTGIPTVYTLHDPMPTGDMLERWLFTRFPTHRFVSVSRSQQGELSGHFVGHVYNGIELSQFPYGSDPGKRLVAVGRMVPEKGQHIAIQVARRTGLPLTIATWLTKGVQSSRYYTEEIAPFVDGKSIVVDSLMQGSDLSKCYASAQALLFPIQWEEPFGLVMIEAMACGTPVIAYNRGSVSEIVRDGVTGFIIEPEDPITKIQDTNKIQKMGIEGLVEAIRRIGEIDRSACRKHVEENFTVEKMVEGYERVYQNVLKVRSKGQKGTVL